MIFNDIKVNINGTEVVKAPRIDIGAGGLFLINGPSGSGKTLLIKTMVGVIDFYEPMITVQGTVVSDKEITMDEFCEDSDHAFYTGQDIENYLTGVYAEDELAGFFFDGDYEKSVEKSLDFLKMHKPEFCGRKLSEMSRGQLQELLFFSAFLSGRRYIFLDEPFSTLDRFERKRLSGLIRKKKSEGYTFVVSGHGIESVYLDFDKVYRIQDRFLMESDAQSVKSDYFSFLDFRMNEEYEGTDEVIMSLDHIGFSYYDQKIIEDMSLDLRKGQVVSFCGINGSGKTTLARIISGELKPAAGKIKGKTSDSVFIGR